MSRLLDIGNVLVPWVTLAGLIVHVVIDIRAFRRLSKSQPEKR